MLRGKRGTFYNCLQLVLGKLLVCYYPFVEDLVQVGEDSVVDGEYVSGLPEAAGPLVGGNGAGQDYALSCRAVGHLFQLEQQVHPFFCF